MYGIGNRAQVVIRQNDTRGCFDVRGEYHIRLAGANLGDNLVNRRRGKRGLVAGIGFDRLEYGLAGRDACHLENLTPAIAEPAVTNDQTRLVLGKLARNGFHTIGATTGNHCHCVGVVHALERSGNVTHDLLEGLRHVIERAIGKDDRVFQQAFGIDGGNQFGHGVSPDG